MKPKDVSEISFDSRINKPDAQRVSLAKFGRHGNDAPKVAHPQSLGKEKTMTIQHPGMSRRTLLSTITLGVPALGLLGAANLIGAPAAQAKSGSLVVDGWWGPATTRRLQLGFGLPTSGVVEAQSAGWAKQNTALSSGWRWVPNSRARGSAVIRGVQVMLGIPQDGLIGPKTIRAVQARYGLPQDGVLVGPSPTIRRFQEELNNPGGGE